MSDILNSAILKAKQLPEAQQDGLGVAISQYVENRHLLDDKLETGIAQLNAGQGQAAVEAFSKLRAKYESRISGSASAG